MSLKTKSNDKMKQNRYGSRSLRWISPERAFIFICRDWHTKSEAKKCSASVENAKWIRLVFCLDKKQEKNISRRLSFFLLFNFIYCFSCKCFQSWPLATTFIEHDPSHHLCSAYEMICVFDRAETRYINLATSAAYVDLLSVAKLVKTS